MLLVSGIELGDVGQPDRREKPTATKTATKTNRDLEPFDAILYERKVDKCNEGFSSIVASGFVR